MIRQRIGLKHKMFSMKYFPQLLAGASIVLLYSCGGKNTPSNVESPGGEKTGKDKLLNTGADISQDKTPLKKFNAYLDGFHFYNGNINAQMEAHHYVNQLNEDLYQAILFDGNGDEEEKKLWHSHHYEVKSGALIAPGIPGIAEHELMEKLVSTYDKTVHTWHTDQQRGLPVKYPMIMMGFTRDGQIHQSLVDSRDKRFDVSTAKIREKRNDIPLPNVDPMANAWEKGHLRQFIITSKVDCAMHKQQGPAQMEHK